PGDPSQGAGDVGEDPDQELALAGRHVIGRVRPRGHDDGDSAAGAGAVYSVGRVADDGHTLEVDVGADEAPRPLAGDARQAPAIDVVRAERADAEVLEEPRRAKLEPRARLDVAGQEAHDRIGARAQRGDELADPGHDLDRAPVAQDRLELAEIRLEARADPRLDLLAWDPGGGQNVPDAALIGLAQELARVQPFAR